jgi:hypothetical protein
MIIFEGILSAHLDKQNFDELGWGGIKNQMRANGF